MSRLIQFDKKFSGKETEFLIADRLIDEIDKSLVDDTANEISSVIYAFFSLAMLEKVLKNRLNIVLELDSDLRKIRNSLAHIDERMELFDYKPTEIFGNEWSNETSSTGQFNMSRTISFQGAIESVSFSTSGEIYAVAPYGIINGTFVWIDKKGKQQHTEMNVIRDSYIKAINLLYKKMAKS